MSFRNIIANKVIAGRRNGQEIIPGPGRHRSIFLLWLAQLL